MSEYIDGEAQEVADSTAAAEPTAELVVREASSGLTLFGTDDPVEVIEKATRIATALADVIENRGLYKRIGDKKHVLVEGWTMLGSMLGVFPVTEWTRQIKDSNGKDGFEARVVAQTRSGEVVGTREAMCSRSESRWAKADDYAIRSMAQTRAVSGALASPLRFVIVLAGYEGTPEAEMHTAGVERVQEQAMGEPEAPRSFGEILERLEALVPDRDDWVQYWIPDAIEAHWGEGKRVRGDLRGPEREVLGQKLGTVVLRLEEEWSGHAVPPPRLSIQSAFAQAFDGSQLLGPPWRVAPDETDRPSKEEWLAQQPPDEADKLADEAITGPEK